MFASAWWRTVPRFHVPGNAIASLVELVALVHSGFQPDGVSYEIISVRTSALGDGSAPVRSIRSASELPSVRRAVIAAPIHAAPVTGSPLGATPSSWVSL